MSVTALICYVYELSEILSVPFQLLVVYNTLANMLYQNNEITKPSVSATINVDLEKCDENL